MARAKFSTTIKADGPFFRKDPDKVFRDNLHDMMLGIAERGRADVVGQMVTTQTDRKPIKKLKDERVSDHVVGELRKRPAGRKYTAVIFVRNQGFTKVEAQSLMAAASKVEGSVHAFRKTFGRIKTNWKAHVDVFKGLN